MRILRLEGSFEDVGRQVGVASGSDVAAVYERLVAHLLAHTAVGSARRMLAVAEGYADDARVRFPEAYVFLRGLADGVGAPFHEIALIAFSEEIASGFHRTVERCSTLAVRTGRGWLIGHNEDYEPHYRGRMLALDVAFDGRPRLACLAYPGQLPATGPSLNACGVAIANNSLWPEAQPGPSQVARQFLAALARDMDEAVRILAERPNALTTHYTVVDGALDDAVSLEVSNDATSESEIVLRQIAPPAGCHTNHVLHLPLRRPDPALAAGSRSVARYEKLKSIPPGALPGTPEEMMAYLSAADGVLHRTPAQDPDSVTLATVVIRPSTGEFWARDADPAAGERDFRAVLKPSSLN